MATHRTDPDVSLTRLFAGMTQCRNPECGAIFDIALKRDDGLCQTCRDRLFRDKEAHPKRSTKDYGSATVNMQYGKPKCPRCMKPILDCVCPPEIDAEDFEEWNARFATGKERKRKKKVPS